MIGETSWTCHACGDERPNRFIGVVTKPLILGGVVASQNIRRCSDRPKCVLDAATYSLSELGRRRKETP